MEEVCLFQRNIAAAPYCKTDPFLKSQKDNKKGCGFIAPQPFLSSL
jgi:hypothetical protein